jgi:hypothetical protein
MPEKIRKIDRIRICDILDLEEDMNYKRLIGTFLVITVSVAVLSIVASGVKEYAVVLAFPILLTIGLLVVILANWNRKK